MTASSSIVISPTERPGDLRDRRLRQFPDPFRAGRVRLESVQNAVDQARCAAARIAGRPEPYEKVPWFWSDQGDLKLQIAGIAIGHDRSVIRGDPASRSFSVFCFSGRRLVGVESVNRPADHVDRAAAVGR